MPRVRERDQFVLTTDSIWRLRTLLQDRVLGGIKMKVTRLDWHLFQMFDLLLACVWRGGDGGRKSTRHGSLGEENGKLSESTRSPGNQTWGFRLAKSKLCCLWRHLASPRLTFKDQSCYGDRLWKERTYGFPGLAQSSLHLVFILGNIFQHLLFAIFTEQERNAKINKA